MNQWLTSAISNETYLKYRVLTQFPNEIVQYFPLYDFR